MAKYQYKVRQVEGFEIVDIQHLYPDHVPGRSCRVKVNEPCDMFEDQWIYCDNAMTARFYPSVGDYIVFQPDRYVYLNPKKVFEDKFEKVGE